MLYTEEDERDKKAVPVAVVDAGPGFTVYKMSDGRVIRRKGDFAWRNNNPGNIEDGDFARNQPGYIEGGGRFAAFDSFESGQRARQNLLFNGKNYKDKTLAQAIYRYAPPEENDTESYIQRLVDGTGVSRDTLMRDLTPEQQALFLKTQLGIEGNKVGKETVLGPGGYDIINKGIPIDLATGVKPAVVKPTDAADLPADQVARNKPAFFDQVKGALLGKTAQEVADTPLVKPDPEGTLPTDKKDTPFNLHLPKKVLGADTNKALGGISKFAELSQQSADAFNKAVPKGGLLETNTSPMWQARRTTPVTGALLGDNMGAGTLPMRGNQVRPSLNQEDEKKRLLAMLAAMGGQA